MQFSARINDLQPSPIREILAVIDRPGMVSFAGGLPSPDSFPQLLADIPAAYLQYGASEGEPELREQIAMQLRLLGFDCVAEQVLVLSGSQQGIDLVAKLFIDRGTPVAVESPTYLAALQAFRFFGASLQAYSLATLHADLKAGSCPAFMYAIPTFQNPTGRCYSAAERAAVAAVCESQEIPLFEDDPYRDLFYDPCDRQPICTQLRRARWIYQGSFSKSLAPGLRLGFLAASPELLPYLVRLKQAADLHSNRLSQYLVLQQLQRPDNAARLMQLAEAYRVKRDRFADLLTRYFGALATWQTPAGGLFFWLKLNRLIDTRQLLPSALEQGVAFMPGEPFYPHTPTASGTLRLNFSHASTVDAERGLATLAELIRVVSAGYGSAL
jgi:DNA-binding transcriptional MocR family regulator